MHAPPLSTSSITDPTSTAFAFPSPTDHPASVDLGTDAVRTNGNDHDHGQRRRHALGHRPHLHIPHHHRPDLAEDEPEQGQRGAELLSVPKTREPHARSLESGTGGIIRDGRGDERRDDKREDKRDTSVARGYDSPPTPVPKSVSQPVRSAQIVGNRDVWSEIRDERCEAGVTPLYLTKTLSTLQSITRSHKLKLSTAQRTIEHRVAEWTVLRDKLEAMDSEAGEVGRGLVGVAEWGRVVRGAVGSEEDDEVVEGGETDVPSPLKTLETLQSTTTHSTTTLTHLQSTVSSRARDIEHLRTKITSDCVALERRMGRGLERKMEGIERAERDAKRRDLIINIVTFTLLIIFGALLSKIVLQLSTSTGRWSVGVGRDWVGRAVGFVKKGV